MIDLSQIVGFDWDAGNARTSREKHGISQAEAESVFVNDPLIVSEDIKHSAEQRFNALGGTLEGRLLHVTFTMRQSDTLVRVISARDMNRKERQIREIA